MSLHTQTVPNDVETCRRGQGGTVAGKQGDGGHVAGVGEARWQESREVICLSHMSHRDRTVPLGQNVPMGQFCPGYVTVYINRDQRCPMRNMTPTIV